MLKREFPFINPDFKKKKMKFSHGKKPYFKKIMKISDFNVWLVDGNYIRGKICEDFVNMGQPALFKFIPKNEFWIAKEANSGEENFYAHHLLIENRLMKKGMSYDKAWLIAASAEKRERMKSKLSKKLQKIKSDKKIVSNNIHKKILEKIGELRIWLVNGEAVRDKFRIDFAGGGHDKVYSFIPRNEIWIDDDLSNNERKFIIIHELKERKLMSKGRKYYDAHYVATELEDIARKKPSKVKRIMKNLS
ncbi:MAG: hypothetical protein AABX93_00420 [Nanoarchaeota archaeon]